MCSKTKHMPPDAVTPPQTVASRFSFRPGDPLARRTEGDSLQKSKAGEVCTVPEVRRPGHTTDYIQRPGL